MNNEKVENRTKELADAVEMAWGLIANAYGGDWDSAKSPDWKPAAERWRDSALPLIQGTDETPDEPEHPAPSR